MKKVNSKARSPAHLRIAGKLAAMRDADIDFSDIPEQLDWKDAKRGVFYKPIKQQLTPRAGCGCGGLVQAPGCRVSDADQRGAAETCGKEAGVKQIS